MGGTYTNVADATPAGTTYSAATTATLTVNTTEASPISAANFYRCVEMITSRLGSVPLVIHLPIGSESEFSGLVDLVKMKAVRWLDESLGAKFVYEEIPADLKECFL